MKMTERFERSFNTSNTTDNNSNNNNNNNNSNSSSIERNIIKHKRHKNSSKSSSSSSSTIIETNKNLFIDNVLSIDTTTSATTTTTNGQLPMEISSPSSSSKPLKIVLKVGQSGSYSPASSSSSSSSNSIHNNNNNHESDTDNKNIKRISAGDNSSSITLAPPELLPLNSDSFHHNVDFQQIDRINNNNRKAKKKKKKHHHHHHHHHHHQQQHLSSSSSNHVIVDNSSEMNSFDQRKEFNNVNDIINVKNVNNESSLNNNILKNSINVPNQNNNDCAETLNTIKEEPLHCSESTKQSIRQQDSVEIINDDDENNEEDDNDNLDNDDDDDDVIMSINQDSIFSSVDLIDIDSCSKLDISALVPDGDEMISELNNGQKIISNEDSRQSINSSSSLSVELKTADNNDMHRTHTKLKTTSSVYRRLLQKGYVRCDSNNLYEHLRRCEKMKTSISTIHKSPNHIQFQNFLLSLLKRLEMKDPQKLFAWPVIDRLMPGYSQVVKHPMDFNTIRKKIEHNIYQSVAELKYDVRLLCENAIRYYRHSGMHYCEASRLWYYAKTRIFARDQLAEHLKQFPPLTMLDLGMDDPKVSKIMNGTTTKSIENCNNIMTNGILPIKSETNTLSLQSLLNDTKCQPNLSSINNHQNGYNTFSNNDRIEQQTPEQILQQHQQNLKKLLESTSSSSSSSSLKKEIPTLTLSRPQNNNHVKIKRQKEDGTTTLPFLVNDHIDNLYDHLTLDHLCGNRIEDGTTSLPEYHESENDRIHPYGYLEESLNNPFGSHLPYMNSGLSDITHNDTLLLFNTFEKFESPKHNEEIERVANDDSYLMETYVDSLLSIVSNGDYKPPDTPPIPSSLLTPSIETNDNDSYNKLDNDIVENGKSVDETKNQNQESNNNETNIIQEKLKETKTLLENLEKIQHQRLKQTTLPIEPSIDEIDMAEKVTTGLVDIIKKWFHPKDVIDSNTIHRNLGIEFQSNDDDEIISDNNTENENEQHSINSH